ncbi:MAG: hypothetical protein HYY17_16240 [Planctomycetes bacterium]|nr:hypothetical protein [Planctomycetota bacterium]
MSAVIVLAPVVVAAWPVMVSAVMAAAAAAGFKRVKEEPKKKVRKNVVELAMENAEVVAESMSPDERIVVEREGVRVVFSRDARGRFRTCVEGDLAKDRLREIGEDLSGAVIQQYVYRRLSQELGRNGFTTLAEEKAPDGAIRLRVRRVQE